ncbi:MarR family winged helix-turn-helix transcriptional regulator [Dellaglioa sp. L3N]
MTDILRPIGVIARALDSIANIEFKAFDLTRGQYLYLVRICEQPGIIQERLSELIKVDRATTARALQKLEKNNFISRQSDAKNNKIKHLFPTEKALTIYSHIIAENNYSNQVALNGLSEKEQQQLAELLIRVSDNVAADWEQVKKGNSRIY